MPLRLIYMKILVSTINYDCSIMKYTVMTPPSRASNYYCELCDKTFVLSAILEEYKVEAMHRGLMEASGKMTRCELQVFRRTWRWVVINKSCSLNKPSCRFCESRWNLAIGVFLFSLNCVLLIFFLFIGFFLSFFFLFYLLPHDSVCDKKLHRPIFSPSRVIT